MVSHPTKCHWLTKGIDQYITVKTWWPQTHHCVQHVCICPAGRVPSSSAGQWAGPRALDQSHGERKWRSSCLDRCHQCPAFCRSSGWRSYHSLCRSPSVHHLEECEVEEGRRFKTCFKLLWGQRKTHLHVPHIDILCLDSSIWQPILFTNEMLLF